MHRPENQNQPSPERLAELLARAERDIAAQRDAYGTELDEDRAWRCAWNTWRTLTDLTTAVHALNLTVTASSNDASVLTLPDMRERAA
ncbi:hypothetical protein [Streptacidiphilus anmyonensis]|uniref:hypothetical protein n=1 Tax=Streptacidiphilus anmyonensis TaxID=405782 RepID=UPI0005A8D640|nr:hypothetical protein [Streptacidiphilus anmyonensis]